MWMKAAALLLLQGTGVLAKGKVTVQGVPPVPWYHYLHEHGHALRNRLEIPCLFLRCLCKP